MSHLLHHCFIALHSQHTIQSHDVLKITALAKAEGIADHIETYSFDELLGLTIYLFVTTQSQPMREQLSLHLSKFGSAGVFPLIKILCRTQLPASIRQLAQQSLDKMALYPLIIGLSHVLDREIEDVVRTVTMDALLKITQENNQSILLLLPKLVSKKTWQALKANLLEMSPYPKFNHPYPDIKISFGHSPLSKDNKQKHAVIKRQVNLCKAAQ